MSLEAMVRDLRAMGVACTVLESGADGALLAAPECGRVLGLWPHWRGENSLWADPAFLGALAIGAKEEGWRCPGGDRMLLAPAGEFLEDGRTPPPSLDPGNWEVRPEKGLFVIENRGDALAWKSGVRVGFRITRRIRPLTEAEMEQRWGPTWLRRAGYAEEAGLGLSGQALPGAALWNTVRVRPGGEERVVADPAGTRCRITRVEEREAGRAILLVRDYDGTRPARDDRDPDGISCFSPPAVGGQHSRSPAGRLEWRLWLCAFSGRLAEARSLAERLEAGA